MINIDQYIVGFAVTNPVTILVFVGLLKGIAKLTPSTRDDKIVTLLTNLIKSIVPKKNNKGK